MTISKKNIFPIVIFISIFIFVNNNSIFPLVSSVMSMLLAGFSVFFVGFTFFSVIQRGSLEKEISSLFLYLILFSMVTAILSFNGLSPLLGLQRAFQLLSVSGVIYIFYLWGSAGKASVVFSFSLKVFLFLIFFYTLISIFFERSLGFSGLLLNPNSFGLWVTIIALTIVGLSKESRFYLFFVFLSIYLVYISSSRTSLLALLVGLGLLITPSYIVLSGYFKKLLIVFLILISFSIVYFSVYFDLSAYNDAVRESSGKNLQSGRDLIWPVVIESIWIKPWFGWGSGASLSDIFNQNLSVHNAFLQTIMQVGFVGFSIFLLILLKVYRLIFKVVDVKYSKLALALFSALIIMQSFEISIFQNNLALSYPVWAVIGLILGDNKYKIYAVVKE